MKLTKKPLGYIAYEGPSALDGAPIVVILTAFDSANAKTGAMVQSFILRADVAPVAALKNGADASVCGACPHRPLLARETGAAPCYVNVGRSVASVYGAYKRGRYARADSATIAAALSGLRLRLGTYGDPAAAPADVWRPLVDAAAGHTGYSHQWAADGFDVNAWAPMVMASADTPAERDHARAIGMRSFRVSIGVDRHAGEVSCPASAEAGARVQCADCLLCGGTSKAARDIVIADHASGHARRVIAIRAAAGVTA